MRKFLKCFFTISFTFLGLLVFFVTLWTVKTFNNVSIDEIIFHFKVPLQGTENWYTTELLVQCLLPTVLWSSGVSIVLLKPWKTIVFFHMSISGQEKKLQILPLYKIKKFPLIMSISLFIFACVFSSRTLKFDDYVMNQMHKSTFIQENYVDPVKVKLTFPEKKRNLIYIYLESMEATYMSKIQGGAFDKNIIRELTNMAEKNLSFSNSDLLGGALPSTGASWTVGAMVAQSSGLPLKIPINGNSMNEYSKFLPGITNLGDILKAEGYHNLLMMGSDATFGGRSNYFQQHGNYEIWDYYTAIKEGKIPKDYRVWWGYEDEKLFSFAKEKLQNLASQDDPFNLTLLTADTHFEDGYVCKLCKNDYSTQYSNVMACSSRQVAEFVEWIQQQDFYKNTTIVISGDHNTMDSDFCENISSNYQRVVYNTFINSAVTSNNTKNRKFITMDLFPTTLSSLGVKIEGDRLALGTNLFSDKKTSVEENGISKFNKELSKKSVFYNNQLLYGSK